jgi:hypothetical protein
MNQKYSLQNNTALVSSKYQINSFILEDAFIMDEIIEESPRSIRFPKNLWEAIDKDAKQAKRSSVKQMEVVLSLYYGLAGGEVNREKLSQIRETQNIPIMEESAGDIKNK